MSLHAEISKQNSGAHFRRGDLHVHSFGDPGFGSYDVHDQSMTPEAIVDTAIAENLNVVAITDHNVVGNVRRAVKHAEGKDVLVVPGVELSTQQGHLLVYCPTVEALESFYGKLTISPDKKACHNTIPQCLEFAADVGGFGIAAHIDIESGLEQAHPKFDAFKQDVFNCKNLLGLEVSNADNSHWFNHADDHVDRRNCVVFRCKHHEHEEEIDLAKVMSSDAHTLGALGRNARGAKKLTRFKMETLTFDSLRIALLDCAARVRLEDLIPASFPHFVGLRIDGGFLKGQIVQFSRNLTCIIGGRGAGKSTMLESLRVCSGNAVVKDIVDSDVWPDNISLIYQDEVGQQHVLNRGKLCEVINSGDPVNGIKRVTIESYGQGETAETIQHCDRDPAILLRFLDGFFDDEGIAAEDEMLRAKLLSNQTEIEKLSIQINRIPDIETAKNTADQQVEALKKQNASELVELEQKLATERAFRKDLTDKLAELLKTMKEALTSDLVRELLIDLDSAKLAVGAAECDEVKGLLKNLADKIDDVAATLKDEVTTHTKQLSENLKKWLAKEQETQKRIEDIRKDLEAQKIKLDIGFIRKVTKDASDYAKQLAELNKCIPKKQDLMTARKELLNQRKARKARLCTLRQSFATLMNKNLAATLVDYRVTIKFHEGVLSPDFEELIKNAMEWRTSQVPRAGLIASAMTPFVLLDAINARNTAPLEAIRDEHDTKVFSKNEALRIFDVLGTATNRFAIERVKYHERPEVTITKMVTDENGHSKPHIKDFADLSLGQQQSILLSIMLFSKSKTPLIIDQPEDNLDSEFIYKTLVGTLRSVKETRQVIVVTHNANIAVLGDAELIIPLRGQSDSSVVRDAGSIDNPKTKELVCTILEGSKRAFKRRHEMYGI